ncbi:hypothetical protein [Pseudonocardia halophobica]|uniref:hypothetical protein n=1 Tax=Pseudonocardia halophobica TaxID=29401 RepID=UPI0018CBFF97
MHVHVECLAGDVLGSTACACGAELRAGMAEISALGRGVLVHVRPARGIRACGSSPPRTTGPAPTPSRRSSCAISGSSSPVRPVADADGSPASDGGREDEMQATGRGSGRHERREPPGQVGNVMYPVRDVEAAVRFYRGVSVRLRRQVRRRGPLRGPRRGRHHLRPRRCRGGGGDGTRRRVGQGAGRGSGRPPWSMARRWWPRPSRVRTRSGPSSRTRWTTPSSSTDRSKEAQ